MKKKNHLFIKKQTTYVKIRIYSKTGYPARGPDIRVS